MGNRAVYEGGPYYSRGHCPVLYWRDLSQVAGPIPGRQTCLPSTARIPIRTISCPEVWADPDLTSKDSGNSETAGEVVRSCLIESRKASVTSYSTFQSMLHANHGRLRSHRRQTTRTL